MQFRRIPAWNFLAPSTVLVGMGYPLRIHVEDGIYHVMSIGNEGKDIFHDADDYVVFLGMAERELRRSGARALSFCPMPNHFHLLIRVALVTLSTMMQRLLCAYAKYHNKKYARKGHLFRSRFKSKFCTNDSYLWELFRYINWNPVKDGLVAGPGDWAWSSHRQLVGPIHSSLLAKDEALSLLGETAEAGRRRYLELLGEPARDFSPEFDDPTRQNRPPPPTMRRAIRELMAEAGLEVPRGPGRPRSLSAARRRFARAAAEGGYGLTEIARELGVGPSAVRWYLLGP